jgi:transcriptional regulator with XRE-family HTH domain
MTELEWMEIFGDNLKEMLEYANMTQRELADEAGLSESSVSKYMHKQAMPTLRAIINIGYALDCDFDDLIDFGEPIE